MCLRDVRLEGGGTLIQVYTGNGKGKTTAAIGLAVRAAGRGLKVYIGQFCKGKCPGELKALQKIKNITVEQFGRGCFIKKSCCGKDKDLAKKGFIRIKEIIKKGKYAVVILDELNVALDLGLLDLKEVAGLLKNAPKNMELVLTGRGAPAQILKIADLVSQIKEKKHYFPRGVKARKGIEY
jgi:cob(I)alamin adenosyltransferase